MRMMQLKIRGIYHRYEVASKCRNVCERVELVDRNKNDTPSSYCPVNFLKSKTPPLVFSCRFWGIFNPIQDGPFRGFSCCREWDKKVPFPRIYHIYPTI